MNSPEPTVCRYCALESAVSHATERECIDELQREAGRLREHLHGRHTRGLVTQQTPEPSASRGFGREAGKAWSPSGDRGRSAAIVSLSLAPAHN